ncbi:MAG: nucleotide exchange factor GrpE, partial [Synergistaceae bacterium]|nr:nucleotide exchange factor GrpE [Synergistaceae bacterium]
MNTEKENTLPEQAEEEICEVEKSIPETEKDTDAEGGDASAFGESPSPPDREAEEMAALIETLEERNRELTAALASARADFFNYRKRVERDRQRERTVAGEEKAMEFIPVLDNLDRALAVKSGSDGKTVLEGV